MSEDFLMISIENTIRVPASEVFRAFTNATALREWLCDIATTEPRAGGRIYLYWNSGNFDAGTFTAVETDKVVEFKTVSGQDPTPLRTRVTLTPQGASTGLTLRQTGFQNPETCNLLQGLWEKSLKNLASVLESGPDLRVTTRPMMGIYFNNMNEKIAKEIGVPVHLGTLVTDVAPGLGAANAGLQKNDVVVELAGVPQVEFGDYLKAMQGKVAGDVVKVVFYRGSEKMSVDMTLSSRKLPDVPPTTVELAEKIRAAQLVADQELDNLLLGASEEAANRHPAEGEWNAKENLAHLLQYERFLQQWIGDLFYSQEPVSDGFGDNLPARIKATVDVYDTLPVIYEEFKRDQAELVETVRNLPPEFAQRKSTWWRMGVHLLNYCEHTRAHVVQIKTALGE